METKETVESQAPENVLRRKRPVWDFGNNRIEIDEIANMAAEYLEKQCPGINFSTYAIAIPRTCLCFMNELLNQLNKIKLETKKPVEFTLGNIMKLGIEYIEISNADKTGSLNPVIYIGPELEYEQSEVPNDELSVEMARTIADMGGSHLPAQFYDDREFYKKISQVCQEELSSQYGIVFLDWTFVPLTTLYFFRAVRKYLIENKDSDEIGIEIDLGNVLSVAIEKDGPDEDVQYIISVKPGQIFKKDYAKGDDITESQLTEA